MEKPVARFIVFLVIFISTVIMPWWLSLAVVIACIIYYPLYLESLFFGFLFDTLYSVGFSFPYTGLTTALVLLSLVSFAKTRIRR